MEKANEQVKKDDIIEETPYDYDIMPTRMILAHRPMVAAIAHKLFEADDPVHEAEELNTRGVEYLKEHDIPMPDQLRILSVQAFSPACMPFTRSNTSRMYASETRPTLELDPSPATQGCKWRLAGWAQSTDRICWLYQDDCGHAQIICDELPRQRRRPRRQGPIS